MTLAADAAGSRRHTDENGFLHVTWAGYEGYVSGAYVAPFGAQGGE